MARQILAIPTVSEDTKSIGTFPTALRKIAIVNTISEVEMILFVPPIFPMRGIKKALPAKHRTDNDVKNESRNELKLYCSFKIGISGLIIVKPARILIAAINIGKAFTIACLLLIKEFGTA